MVEVRDLRKDETLPDNGDWVLIEKVGERFTANGSVSGKRDATFFTPPAFQTEEAAIAASKAWAEANDVSVVYVRDAP